MNSTDIRERLARVLRSRCILVVAHDVARLMLAIMDGKRVGD